MTVNFSGTWKGQLERSHLAVAPPAAISASIEQTPGEVRLDLLILLAAGSAQRAILVCKEGQSTCSLNGKQLRGSMTWNGPELVIETFVETGANTLNLRDYWSLSPDGKQLSMEHRDDDLAGQIVVFERVE